METDSNGARAPGFGNERWRFSGSKTPGWKFGSVFCAICSILLSGHGKKTPADVKTGIWVVGKVRASLESAVVGQKQKNF
jgi:hypothetical protein